jgi:hypothetical protein
MMLEIEEEKNENDVQPDSLRLRRNIDVMQYQVCSQTVKEEIQNADRAPKTKSNGVSWTRLLIRERDW